MNTIFLNTFLEKCNFSTDAKIEINELSSKIKNSFESDIDNIVSLYTKTNYDFEKTDLCVKDLCQKHNFVYYSIWLLVLIFAAETAKELYKQKNIDEVIFWETFADIKFKADECKTMHDIYGTFVA